jgi:hypothetical protein
MNVPIGRSRFERSTHTSASTQQATLDQTFAVSQPMHPELKRPFIMQFGSRPDPTPLMQFRYDSEKQLVEVRKAPGDLWTLAIETRQIPCETRVTKIQSETTDDD